MINFGLIFFGTFLMAIAGVIYYETDKYLLLRFKLILILIGILLISFGTYRNSLDQKETGQKLIKVTDKNNELNIKISKLSRTALATITGGDSYVYVIPRIILYNRNIMSFLVVSSGNYPLYDVSIRITDSDLSTNLIKPFLPPDGKSGIISDPVGMDNAIKSSETNYYFGNKIPGYGTTLPFTFDLNYNNLKKREFVVIIYARNGSFYQKLIARKVNGNWIFAFRITKDHEEIHRSIAPNYPLNANKDVDW